MKVLHIITALNYGGAEAMLSKLLSQEDTRPALANAVVLSLMAPGIVGQQMARQGVTIETLDLKHPWHLPQCAARLARIVRRHAPDLIQGWMYHGNLAATAAGKIAAGRPPVLWNIRHSLNRPSAEKPLSRMVIRLGALLSRGPQATIYNSATALQEHAAYGYSTDRAIVIPNGFDHQRFQPDTPERPVRQRVHQTFGIGQSPVLVALVARSHPMKDHATAIEAVGRARQMGHDVHLLLAGDGTDALPPKLQDACARWLPYDRLTLLGDRRDVAEWLPGCDILALSSAWGEGFPNILGEAMASGIPCIATDVGDSKAIMADSGICVPIGSPHAMAEAIATLCTTGLDGRRQIGERGRNRIVSEFSLPKIADRYARLYESMTRPNIGASIIADPSQCAG